RFGVLASRARITLGALRPISAVFTGGTRVALGALSAGRTISTSSTGFALVAFRPRGQLNAINISADLFHRVHNLVVVFDVSVRTLNRLSWQFNIPISHPVAPSNQRASIPSPSC